ncbi:alpha-2-macroglobulin-like protein [Plakobranchus ocellatus]|uniref:Alpha-2-macroglobulin-like protein n=1 Tax=Plakobranchus ocellatus TaxID=259542 RepID=A0AAV3YAZ4_9GAST|nr:alpha-2-macroglobulin-like protein [Plakobranchus ocellatus]
MSRNVVIAPGSLPVHSTLSRPLPSLVTSMVSSPRIDFNSLWILKDDRNSDLFKLITSMGDTLIKIERSSAGNKNSPTSCQTVHPSAAKNSITERCLMRRSLDIDSIYIKDPNGFRIEQYLNLTTKGLISLDFHLGKEAKQGSWKIEVNLDTSDEDKEQKTVGKFTVKEYFPPPFEITIEPPPYIMLNDQIVSGRVCGRYTYGKKVRGNLSLDVCWIRPRFFIYRVPLMKCHHIDTRLDGCYNFSVNSSLMRVESHVSCELHFEASITEFGTGITLFQKHTGPQEEKYPLTIRFDDYSIDYFKPRLPYYNKVIVTKLDGTPASGEAIEVTADSRDKSLRFQKNFTTDESGVIKFALCGNFTEVTKGIRIIALATNYDRDEFQDFWDLHVSIKTKISSTIKHLELRSLGDKVCKILRSQALRPH